MRVEVVTAVVVVCLAVTVVVVPSAVVVLVAVEVVVVAVVVVLGGGVFAAWHPVNNDNASNKEASRVFIGITSSTADTPQNSGAPICVSFHG